MRECTPRIQRDFNEEFPKLRIFSHPNILPVVSLNFTSEDVFYYVTAPAGEYTNTMCQNHEPLLLILRGANVYIIL